MTNDSKKPTETPKSTGTPEEGADDRHLDDGELSAEDLESIAGGGSARKGSFNTGGLTSR